jgi:hypothetical protein
MTFLGFGLGLAFGGQAALPPPIEEVPTNTGLPVISGTAIPGETLTLSTGTWTGSPTSFAFTWRRNGVAIPGATASTYVYAREDLGANLTGRVVPSNAAGAGLPAESAAVTMHVDYVVDPAGNDTTGDGSSGTPWATITKLATVLDGLAGSFVKVGLVKSGTYTNNEISVSLGSGNVGIIVFEDGTVIECDNIASVPTGSATNADSGTLKLIGLGSTGGRITGYTDGGAGVSGNGLGASSVGRIEAYNFVIDDCVDGWSCHNDATSHLEDVRIHSCTKSAFLHINNTVTTALRCSFEIGTPTNGNVYLGGHTDASTGTYTDCDAVPHATTDSTIGLGVGMTWADGRLGTLTRGWDVSGSGAVVGGQAATIVDSFVNMLVYVGQAVDLTGCFGYLTFRHRLGASNPSVVDGCVFGGDRSGYNGNTFLHADASFAPSGRPLEVKNTIVTGYSLVAFGQGADATRAAQIMDGPLEVHHVCLFGNGTNFDADLVAHANYATQVHDNITSNPLIGDKSTMTKASWGYGVGSPCIGAGEGGANIGFPA